MKWLIWMAGLAWAGSAGEVAAQLAAPAAEPITGARMPALSPDGKHLAFVYRGDVWTVSAKGGRATALTQHVETDAFPLFSPDGKWIAFASKRNGNWDIYAAPAEGGSARQLTYHSGAEIAYGWSPDGTKLLFAGKRDTPNYGLYALDVNLPIFTNSRPSDYLMGKRYVIALPDSQKAFVFSKHVTARDHEQFEQIVNEYSKLLFANDESSRSGSEIPSTRPQNSQTRYTRATSSPTASRSPPLRRPRPVRTTER